jgi:hypothetical protein
MVVRVDKCSTFGIKKVLSKSAQYLPKLLIMIRISYQRLRLENHLSIWDDTSTLT